MKIEFNEHEKDFETRCRNGEVEPMLIDKPGKYTIELSVETEEDVAKANTFVMSLASFNRHHNECHDVIGCSMSQFYIAPVMTCDELKELHSSLTRFVELLENKIGAE